MTPEGQNLNAILQYLDVKRIFHWRNNSGAVKAFRKNGDSQLLKFGKVGSSDILGCLCDGKLLAIEVKSDTGRLSIPQSDFLDSISALGGVAFMARSIDDVERELSKRGYV